MTTLSLSLSLLLAVLLATIRTWKGSKWLRSHFIVQVVAWFVLELPQDLHLVTKHDWRYAFLWVMMTVAAFAAAAGYVWEQAKEHRWVLFVAAPILPTLLIWVELYLGQPASFPQRISMGTGAFEAWLGVSALTVAQSRITEILGYLWLAQAAYQVAFTLRLFVAFDTWKQLNNFIPWAMVVVAFTVIGVWRDPNPIQGLERPGAA